MDVEPTPRDRIDASRPRAIYVRDASEPPGVAVTNAPARGLELLLERLAELAMESTGADRVAFLLLDEAGEALHLWGAVTARSPPEGLWDLGRSLPGIPMGPQWKAILAEGEPVVVADASDSPLVPADWVGAFGLRSLILAPVVHDGQPLGTLAVDFSDGRRLPAEFGRMIGTVARTTAMAITSTGLLHALTEEQLKLGALLEAAEALAAPKSLQEVGDRVADAIVRVLGAAHLSIHLLDTDGMGFQTLTQRNMSMPDEGTLTRFPKGAVERVTRAWAASRPPKPVVIDDFGQTTRDAYGIPDDVGVALVLPLSRAGRDIFGFILVGCSRDRPPTTAIVDLAATLAAHVGFAFDRALKDEQVAVAAEFARSLLVADNLGDVGPDGLLDALRHALPRALGFEVVGVLVSGAGDAPPAGSEEHRLLRNWRRRRTAPDAVERGPLLHVPMWSGGRLHGIVTARALAEEWAPHQRDLVAALAGALTDVMDRRAMRRAMEERDRELALAAERAAVAGELHAAVGHVLATIASVSDEVTQGLSGDEVLRNARRVSGLARTALYGLDNASAGLRALQVPPDGMGATIKEIVARLGTRIGADANLEVRGEPRSLPTAVEQALIRVIHEAISRVGGNGHASSVSVRLEFGADEVELVVRDDGSDLSQRDEGVVPATHFGLRVMERRVEELGGVLVIERSQPRGVLVRARIPA